jgi:DNA polymerase I
MKVAVSTIEYTKFDDEPIVHVYGRDEEGNRQHLIVNNLKPFFYVPASAVVPKNKRVTKVVKLKNWKAIDGTPVKKIYMKLPADVGGDRKLNPGFRERFRVTYEDDILFHNRAQIELGIKSGVEVESTELDFDTDEITPVDFKHEQRICHLDIETSMKESHGYTPSWKNPVNKIYCICCFDSYDKKFVTFVWSPNYKNGAKYSSTYETPIDVEKFPQFEVSYPHLILTFTNERQMLEKFSRYVQDKNPDIITGWNARKFDVPYIIERMKKVGANIKYLSPLRTSYVDSGGWGKIKGRVVFDTWDGFRKTLTSERESNKLGDVSTDLLGVGKVDLDEYKHDFDKIWKHHRDHLIHYNAQDVFLEMAISVTQKVFQFFYDVKCFVGCHFDDVMNNSRVVDIFALHEAKRRKTVLPSKRERDNEDGSYKGADVIQPLGIGIFRWLGVLDLKSLYPMIMLMLNMGIDTLVKDPPEELIPGLHKSPIEGVYFRKDKQSLVAGLIKQLVEYRDSLKSDITRLKDEIKSLTDKNEVSSKKGDVEVLDRIQVVIKFITNTFYGVMGFTSFRAYSVEIAASITAVGREVLSFTMDYCNAHGFPVKYGDTDSLFIRLVETLGLDGMLNSMDVLCDALKVEYERFATKYNVDENLFKMKYEKVYKTFFMTRVKSSEKDKKRRKTAKKRYAGWLVWKDGFEVDEVEVKGFDRSDMSRDGNRIMDEVLDRAVHGNEVVEIESYIRKEVATIKKGKRNLIDIAFSKGVKKPLDTYGREKNGKRIGIPDWIRATQWTNKNSGKWKAQTNYGNDSKPKFVYLKKNHKKFPKDYGRIEIAALDDNYSLPDEIRAVIDYDTVIEKTIGYKVDTILEAIGTSWDKINSKTRTDKFRVRKNVKS